MKKARVLSSVGIVALVGLVSVLAAQAPASLAFEAVSIKPNKSGDPNREELGIAGRRFTAVNVPLQELIRLTYSVQNFELIGAPKWIESDRFDVDARAGAELRSGAVPQELRALLAERFSLRVHKEVRQLPIYVLVFARDDHKLGSSLTKLMTDYCEENVERLRGNPADVLTAAERNRCTLRSGRGTLTARSMGMSSLAGRIASVVNRPVTDKTGLVGPFDFDLAWTPDDAVDQNGPSIFTALQEQLGLKLASTRGPVDVLVIDHVEHPTED